MIHLDRIKTGDYGTFGMLTDDDGLIKSHVFTIERPMIGDHPCINPGIYTFNQYDSPTKGDVWLREDCGDGRTMIEIHAADMASQLRGCIAPGSSMGELNGIPAVLGSKDTFKMLKLVLPKSFQMTITGIGNA